MEYTKGEWKSEHYQNPNNSAIKSNGRLIARDITNVADANLIAAAPDVYEALKAVKQWENDPEMYYKEIKYIVDKSLAKAEGK